MRFLYTAFITLISFTIFGQQAAGGKITGTVIAESGKKPLVAATIEVTDPAGKTVDAALSDDYGTFLLDKLNQGDGLIITITVLGYKDYTATLDWKKANKDGEIKPRKNCAYRRSECT